MASTSHNGALMFGVLLGVAGGAAWAIWNATESGEKLRAETRAMIDAALGRTQDAAPVPIVNVSKSGSVQAQRLDEISPDGSRPTESPAFAR